MLKIPFSNKNDFTAKIPQILTYVDGLDDGEYLIQIEKKSRPRSIKANNYSWTLTDKLAEVMLVGGVKITKDEMHAEMIYRYGQALTDEHGTVVISTASNVPITDYIQYAKEIGEGEVNGKTFKHYRVYRGSHTYNSAEMSIFINGIIEECKEQGIETATPEELARMIDLMRNE